MCFWKVPVTVAAVKLQSFKAVHSARPCAALSVKIFMMVLDYRKKVKIYLPPVVLFSASSGWRPLFPTASAFTIYRTRLNLEPYPN